MIKRIKEYDWKKYNFSLLMVVVIICLIGAFCVKMAGGEEHGSSFMRNQIVGMMLGVIIVLILSIFDYHFICQFTVVYYIAGILLTAATHTSLGTNNNTDVKRWVKLGPITFQPTELMKIILILTLATVYAKLRNKVHKVSTLLIVFIITMIPVTVILLQPDLSSALVSVFVMAVLVFAAGTSYKIIAPIIIVGIPSVVIFLWYNLQPGSELLSKIYQLRRIYVWLHPEDDPDMLNWQQNNCIRAIASGQLYGKYMKDGGEGTLSRAYNSVSVNESDFIWAIVGEEFGFLGSCLVLMLFAIVIFKCFSVAKKAQDFQGRLIAIGVAAMFMFQVFSNICVATRLFPNTGLPLPFISNGLSSMISSMIGIGLVMNVGIQPAKSSNAGFTMRNSYGSDSARDIDVDLDL